MFDELQKGFRPGRRLEDNLFVITQCIEISMEQQRVLLLAFLDIDGAYENIDQGLLFDILQEVGVTEDCMKLLREIYKDNEVQITWEGRTSSQPINIHRRLKQGCPLYPNAVYYLCRRIKIQLEESKLRFDLSHYSGGQVGEQRISGVIYGTK